jgi:nitroreductase
METWDTIRARRNVRQYTDQPIARADLERILDAGRRAASASNWQPWNFVVVTDRPQLVELAKVWQGARHVARSAATVAFVVRQPEDTRRQDLLMYDLGQATRPTSASAPVTPRCPTKSRRGRCSGFPTATSART